MRFHAAKKITKILLVGVKRDFQYVTPAIVRLLPFFGGLFFFFKLTAVLTSLCAVYTRTPFYMQMHSLAEAQERIFRREKTWIFFFFWLAIQKRATILSSLT